MSLKVFRSHQAHHARANRKGLQCRYSTPKSAHAWLTISRVCNGSRLHPKRGWTLIRAGMGGKKGDHHHHPPS